ncbi:hypothetical protein [Marinobacter sp. LV10R510-11A]|jgi:hypothetical protein|uniref:hypothetical protein n=1 Tax=Marinobacter sp. LV10R510-11A TaxID=1415568 RepID=UPI000BB6C2A5|nr:hypothetical protein [Marinobacter sp. LV10R510-11A]
MDNCNETTSNLGTGKYAWEDLDFGRDYRIEITDTGFAIFRLDEPVFIPFAEVAKVYLKVIHAATASERVQVEIINTNGEGFAFHALSRSYHPKPVSQCRLAASALLQQLVIKQPKAKIFEGCRTGTPLRIMAAGFIAFGVVQFVRAFDGFVLGNPERAENLAWTLSIFVVFGVFWALLFNRKTREVPVAKLLRKLEAE